MLEDADNAIHQNSKSKINIKRVSLLPDLSVSSSWVTIILSHMAASGSSSNLSQRWKWGELVNYLVLFENTLQVTIHRTLKTNPFSLSDWWYKKLKSVAPSLSEYSINIFNNFFWNFHNHKIHVTCISLCTKELQWVAGSVVLAYQNIHTNIKDCSKAYAVARRSRSKGILRSSHKWMIQ